MKIGIITRFYNNINYGGCLQAYALTSFLKKNGFDAEQIRYKQSCLEIQSYVKLIKDGFEKRLLIRNVKDIVRDLQKKIKSIVCNKKFFKEIVAKRHSAFDVFSDQMVPHSECIYSSRNITETNQLYDLFISGSDQVWNLDIFVPEYFLNFVDDGKIKMSYAASMAMDILNEDQKKFIAKMLNGFKHISVREKRTVELLERISPVEISYVVDPTLLLSSDEWGAISVAPKFNEKYVFAYFLGNNKYAHSLAREYASKKKLKLVCIPMCNDGLHYYDMNYADENILCASPGEFIGLIKNAEYVFTDSFHCVIFSHIFQKQYYVFDRNLKGTMSSRICSLVELFNSESHYYKDGKNVDTTVIQNTLDINYKDCSLLNSKIEMSKKDLLDSLKFYE